MDRIEALDFIVLNLGHARTVHAWGNRDISSPFARIYYVKQGRAVVHLPACDQELSPGHMYLIPTFQPHSYECDPGFEFYYLFVYQRMSDNRDVFEAYDLPLEVRSNEATQLLFENYCTLYPQLHLPTADAEQFDRHPSYRDYAKAYMHMEAYERMQLHGLVEILFSYFMKHGHATSLVNDPRLQRVLTYIHQHLSSPITLEQLADVACLTRASLIRSFRQALAITPLQYILRRKIQEAQALLLGTDLTVQEIGRRVGFEDTSYFIRLFRKSLGFTPQDYRENLVG